MNYNKNETESKMEKQIKSKIVMSWSSQKKKEDIFCTVYFAREIFCVLSQCMVY